MTSKFKLYFLFILGLTTFVSCKKDDDGGSVPLRDHTEQAAADNDSIEAYLKSHYMTVNTVDGLIDVDIQEIPPNGTQTSIWDNTEYPLVKDFTIKNMNRTANTLDGRVEDPVDYKLYYLLLNEGGGDRPASTDSVFCSYKGWMLDGEEFDRNNNSFWSTCPAVTSAEVTHISGFREFVPMLRASDSETDNGDGTFTFNNSGAGVVFLPSGLAYFNSASGSIPAYTPIAFLVRLNKVRYRDHDRDGVLSKYENKNTADEKYEDYYNDDTDGDNIPDFLDIDDDNDGYSTRREITIPGSDDEVYPYDQIQNCTGGTAGLKKFVDSSCH